MVTSALKVLFDKELDTRVLKLVVRLLQSARLDPARLAFRARRERADLALHWVLSVIPECERNDRVRAREAIGQLLGRWR